MHFGNFCGLYSPVLGLLFSLGTYVELVQEVLYITLVLDGQRGILEVLSKVQMLVYVYLIWWISASSNA